MREPPQPRLCTPATTVEPTKCHLAAKGVKEGKPSPPTQCHLPLEHSLSSDSPPIRKVKRLYNSKTRPAVLREREENHLFCCYPKPSISGSDRSHFLKSKSCHLFQALFHKFFRFLGKVARVGNHT